MYQRHTTQATEVVDISELCVQQNPGKLYYIYTVLELVIDMLGKTAEADRPIPFLIL